MIASLDVSAVLESVMTMLSAQTYRQVLMSNLEYLETAPSWSTSSLGICVWNMVSSSNSRQSLDIQLEVQLYDRQVHTAKVRAAKEGYM